MSVQQGRAIASDHRRAEGGANDSTHPRKWRIALYSHDTMGIGHTRRNLLIAQVFARLPVPASILLVAGAREVAAFDMPPGTDCLTLPSLYKELDGCYRPRCLDVPLTELIAMRAQAIRAGLEAFEPDVFIVDKEPRGVFGELDPILKHLRRRGRTRCVLGLRDVLDDPAAVCREWRAAGNEGAIRDCYDAVWVYGDRAVFDPVREYCFSDGVATKVRFTGYLDRHLGPRFTDTESADILAGLPAPSDRLALCMVGGGQDGEQLAEAFAQADLPPGFTGVILTGPLMPPEAHRRLLRRAAACPRLRVLGFVTDPDLLLSCADRVVAMGGYNTVFEVLSAGKHALIVPRVRPRQEQIIRAERLRALGLLDMLHPDQATPQALADWLARDLGPPPRPRERIDLGGTARLPQLLAEVLGLPSHPPQTPAPEEVLHAAL